MLLRLLCCVLLLWLSRDHVTSLDLEPGISEALAADRARRVSDVRYALSFVIPELKGQPIEGRAEIRLRLSDASRPLALDFQATPSQVRGVTVAGRAAPSAIVNGHLVVTPEWLATGENEIAIEFTAGDVPFNRQDDFLYTLFVPARAHEAFPCFDQPDLKARVSLTLDVPAGWTAVANAAELDRAAAAGRTRVRFAESEPISTYLLAFAAGKLSVDVAARDDRTLRMIHRETDTARLERNRDTIFDLHASTLTWMEQYTNIPYP